MIQAIRKLFPAAMSILMVLALSIAMVPATPVWAAPGPPHEISLDCNPDKIAADGVSTSALSATVLDEFGDPVANGTAVDFSTDLGTIDSVTTTTDGVATAILHSPVYSDQMHVAKVTATVDALHDSVPVFFIPPGGTDIGPYGWQSIIGSGTVSLWYGAAIFDTTGEHFIVAALYEGNPGGPPTFNASGMYFDIHLDNIAGLNSLTLTSCTEEILPDTIVLTVYYWDGTAWKPVSNQTWDGQCITVVITADTFPSLSDLTGLPFAFGVAQLPPTISSVNPSSAYWGQSLPVVITGTNFTGVTAVNFGTGITSNFTVNSTTQITANITVAPGADAGARDISVTTPGGTATLADGFTVIPLIPSGGTGSHSSSLSGTSTQTPTIIPVAITVQSASLSAKSVTPGTPVTVTADIANKSTVNGSKKVTLYVNGQVETTQGVTVNSGSSSKLTFNVSRSEPGDYSVYVDGVPAGSFKVELMTANDGILIFSVVLVALALVAGMVVLWRRQRAG
jgi:hypothetical protein